MSEPGGTDFRDAKSRPLRVAMLLHGQYPWDERVKREAQALVDAGHEVDVICLKQSPDEQARETVDGVRVFRLPMRRGFGNERAAYLFEYGAAFAGCMWRLTVLNARRRYDVVQIHTLPDALVFASASAKLTGARVVLDIHDLMPELYMSKFDLAEESRVVRVLRSLERSSTRYADRVITASEAFAARLVASGVPADKVSVVLNTADPEVFPAPRDARLPGSSGGFTVFWHGTMVRRYGLDLAVRAVAALRDRVPGLRFLIYGEGECADEIQTLVGDLGVSDIVELRGHLSHLVLASHIASADVGIVPNIPDVHIEMAYPTKLLEFVQMGVPVVATRTRVLEGMFGEGAVVFCDATPESLEQGLEWIYRHPFEAQSAARRAAALCEPVSWEHMGANYVGIIEDVAVQRGERGQAAQR